MLQRVLELTCVFIYSSADAKESKNQSSPGCWSVGFVLSLEAQSTDIRKVWGAKRCMAPVGPGSGEHGMAVQLSGCRRASGVEVSLPGSRENGLHPDMTQHS